LAVSISLLYLILFDTVELSTDRADCLAVSQYAPNLCPYTTIFLTCDPQRTYPSIITANVAMNVSVPTYDEGSPILYNVAVSIDRVSYSLKRRYNEFVDLSGELETEMGEPAPVELPGKKWLGRQNAEFLDERRRGLEAFLRAICKRSEWRDSLAMSKFLERSKHTQSEASKLARARNDWIKGINDVEDLLQRASSCNQSTVQRRLLSLAASRLASLEAVLTGDDSIGPGERDRRKNSLDAFSLRISQMRAADSYGSSRSPTPTSAGGSRNGSGELRLSGPRATGRVLGAAKAATETDRTRELNNAGLMSLQQEDMQEQNAQLESLRRTIARQRELGLAIQAEVNDQNDMLEELDADVHAVNSRLNQARRQTKKFT
jgi:regulator of vacuolar morphogenesis